jgi:NAD(P)-dependent dehydrogenase (short-subunit alcohol dehydrogenase family)
VVTGGTGALGAAVVGALRAAGAVCHVTNMVAAELEKYPHRNDPGVHITTGIDLADEAAVRRFYASLPPLWGSIHLAGGFAMSPVAETSAVDFADQFQMNALSSFLSSVPAAPRAGASSMSRRGPAWSRGSAPAWSPMPPPRRPSRQ